MAISRPNNTPGPEKKSKKGLLAGIGVLAAGVIGYQAIDAAREDTSAQVVKASEETEPENDKASNEKDAEKEPDAETPKLVLPKNLPSLQNLPTLSEDPLLKLAENDEQREAIAWLLKGHEKEVHQFRDLCQKIKTNGYNQNDPYKPLEITEVSRLYTGLARNLRELFKGKEVEGENNWPNGIEGPVTPSRIAIKNTLDVICGHDSGNGEAGPFYDQIIVPLERDVALVVSNPNLSNYEKYVLLNGITSSVLRYIRTDLTDMKSVHSIGINQEQLATIGLKYREIDGSFYRVSEGGDSLWKSEKSAYVQKIEELLKNPNLSEEEKRQFEDMLFDAKRDVQVWTEGIPDFFENSN